MHRELPEYFLLWLLLFAAAGQAQEAETIAYWAKPSFAPLFIHEGASRNQGFGDLILAELKSSLPQYQHQDIHANYTRILAELRKGTQTCAILHHSHEREAFIHFSDTLLITPSYQLYSRVQHQGKFQQYIDKHSGLISLGQLLSSPQQLTMAHTPGHSYGKVRDAILAQHKDKLRIVKGYAGQTPLIKMLLAQRVDLILEFPWVINHQLKQLHMENALYQYVLADAPAYVTAYIGCPKSLWGKTMISALNNLTPPMHERVKAYLEKYLAVEERSDYRRAYADFFGVDSMPTRLTLPMVK